MNSLAEFVHPPSIIHPLIIHSFIYHSLSLFPISFGVSWEGVPISRFPQARIFNAHLGSAFIYLSTCLSLCRPIHLSFFFGCNIDSDDNHSPILETSCKLLYLCMYIHIYPNTVKHQSKPQGYIPYIGKFTRCLILANFAIYVNKRKFLSLN